MGCPIQPNLIYFNQGESNLFQSNSIQSDSVESKSNPLPPHPILSHPMPCHWTELELDAIGLDWTIYWTLSPTASVGCVTLCSLVYLRPILCALIMAQRWHVPDQPSSLFLCQLAFAANHLWRMEQREGGREGGREGYWCWSRARDAVWTPPSQGPVVWLLFGFIPRPHPSAHYCFPPGPLPSSRRPLFFAGSTVTKTQREHARQWQESAAFAGACDAKAEKEHPKMRGW